MAKIGKPKPGKSYMEKEKIVKRLNERIASIVRHSGTGNEAYNRWASKLTRPNTPYQAQQTTYNPDKVKLAKNKGRSGAVDYVRLSRKKSDIEAMDIKDLKRLEAQTKGWGEVKKEAKEAIKQQRQKDKEREALTMDQIPFIKDQEAAAPAPVTEEPITDEDINNYLYQKETVRQFIEGNSDAFYALIESTGWDDIREHTTDEIYQHVRALDMASYKFKSTHNEVSDDYISRRTASREHRKAIGIL